MNLRPKEILVAFGVTAVFVVACIFAFDGFFSSDNFWDDVPAKTPEPAVAESIVLPGKKSSPAPKPSFPSAEKSVPAKASVAAPTPEPKLARAPAKAPRPTMKNFSCAGEICIDADSGEILLGKNENVRHPPASVTKLMTIFVVLDAVSAKKTLEATECRQSFDFFVRFSDYFLSSSTTSIWIISVPPGAFSIPSASGAP